MISITSSRRRRPVGDSTTRVASPERPAHHPLNGPCSSCSDWKSKEEFFPRVLLFRCIRVASLLAVDYSQGEEAKLAGEVEEEEDEKRKPGWRLLGRWTDSCL